MSRLILGLVVVVVCLSSTLALAGEPVNRDGQWGLGANTGGVALRHWLSDGLALQLMASLDWTKDGQYTGDEHNINAGFAVVPRLATRGNVRLEGIAALRYWGYRYTSDSGSTHREQNNDTYFVSAGVGVEYHFDELPNLTFGASLVAVSLSYGEEENSQQGPGGSNSTKNYPKGISTFSNGTLGVIYYF